MNINVEHHDGYVLAQTHGHLDETAAELFREYLHPLVAQNGTNLIIDLSQSMRISSQGVAYLVMLVADANTHDSKVILAAPSPFISSVLNVTKLNSFFEVEASLAAAVQRVAPP